MQTYSSLMQTAGVWYVIMEHAHFPWHLFCIAKICVTMNLLHTHCASVQFSHSVMSDSLWPHESQHARPPCPSPTPKVHPDSRPSSQWCHPAISSSVVPFSSCPQFLPAWGGQSTGVSASASFPPKKSQGWSSEWTGGFPYSPRDSQASSPTPQFKSMDSLALSFLHSPTLTSIHDYWKNHSLD